MFAAFSYAEVPAADESLRALAAKIAAAAVAGTPLEIRARSWTGFDAQFSRKLGNAGLIGLMLPVEYGGAGRGPFARYVVVEELLSAGAPVAAHWIAERQSAPLLIKFGTPEQRRRYIPGICRGETFFCIGMSEPDAGSDLAAVRTTAEAAGKGWRLNGQKIWTSNAARSHYMIALVRTSGQSEDRHRGLSQVIVDLRLPGVDIRPIRDLAGDDHFAEVFFDNVELGPDALIGEEGMGWQQVVAELAYERSGPERIYSSMVLLDGWRRHLHKAGRTDDTTAQILGCLLARMASLRAMSLACTAQLAAGESPEVEACMVKDLGTAFEQDIPRIVGDDLASHPEEHVEPELYRALAYLEMICPSFSLRGGTREILRGIIARGMHLR
ncbi:acyl-CoA dehydrogenase [Sphingomonas sp. ID1715]|uniref:acyl-CoA dehydrogenase family protein n=1 Tax=Sphingomonas sp. ID1715 TaxID=1656898 RepID=UPI0014883388|nr:acyl-CoA dehydrogenase family protein [Sphingomonas sp. ID1715]NNM78071.1 acyl-CoA dehydrogenase [Sphingomonas sp. ID1715]